MLGFPNKKAKKKVIPEPPKPSITKKLTEEFGPLNEWSEKPTGPKRWFKKMDEEGLTEFEQQQMNEGPAYEYEPYMHAISQNYDKYWKSVKDLGRALEKKGLKKQSKELFMAYRKQVSKFEQWMPKFIRKLL